MGTLRWTWRRLTAMRTAVVLLTLVAVAAVPGSLLPQRNVASDPLAVVTFYDENPDLARVLDRLQLFDVYSSPWFAATYLLLLVSMTGCVLPRCARLWREMRMPPPPAPRHLEREQASATWVDDRPGRSATAVLDDAEKHLRARRFRVVRQGDEVRAETGYVREAGNLAFHLSLLVLLAGVAVGRLYGYEGRVAIAEGGGFTNVVSEYDVITPSVWTDTDELEPLSFTLDSFDASFETSGTKIGEPRDFDARLTVTTPEGTSEARVRPNHPLDVGGTKFFLTGHGYAPIITVKDGEDQTVYSGPVVFLPADPNLTSDGVLKAPDAQPLPLGFEGLLLPTAGDDRSQLVSSFPSLVSPRLDLKVWTGDLGLNDGTPQSVYTLDKTLLEPLTDSNGRQVDVRLGPGDTVTLPNGAGSVSFDGVARFANFQIARDPGKEISLLAAILLLGGLTISLAVRRRRIWVRALPLTGSSGREGSEGCEGCEVTIASRALARRALPPSELADLRAAVDGTHETDPTETPTRHEEPAR